MRIVIDIPDGCYKELNNGQFPIQDAYRLVAWIKDGTPLPEGAEILTKDAYSDLCTRAAEQLEKRTEERTETHACVCGEEETHEKRTEPCENCISREAAIKCCWKPIVKPNGMIFDALKRAIQSEIETLPPIEPERKTGMWIHDEDWECDQCGKHFINVDEDEYGVPHFDFCPNCGCEMGVL